MNRLAYWKAKLKAAIAVSRQRQKEAQQATRAWARATRKVEQIEQKVEHETTKLARLK
jgi:hypothetical protein